MLACVLLSIPVISLMVWLFSPSITMYRGLSGIDTALFSLLCFQLLGRKIRRRDWKWTAVIATVLAGFIAKICLELNGLMLFVAPDASFVPVPIAHVAGGICGLIIAGTQLHKSPRGFQL
jgi:hypothetical protein